MRPGAWLLGIGALLTLTAALAGCGDDDTPSPAAQLPVTPTALAPAAAAMLDEAARVRGLAPPADLQAALITRAQLPAVLETTLTEADRAWFARTTTLYRMLGYLAPDEQYLDLYLGFARDAVIGLYDPARQTIWLVSDRPEAGFDGLGNDEQAAFRHELIHALQDAHFGLERGSERAQADYDANLAWTALVEGDATLHAGLGGLRGAAPGGTVLLLASAQAAPGGLSAPIERALRFPYEAGAEWVRSIAARGGTAAIDALFREPSASTALILHPDGATQGRRPQTVTLPDLTRALGGGWKRESGGALGEFEWMNFLQQRLKGLEAATAAAGWDGDHYDIYAKGSRAVFVARVTCASDEAAARLRSALLTWASDSELVANDRGRYTVATAAGSNTLAIARGNGRDVVAIIATDPADAEAAMRVLAGG